MKNKLKITLLMVISSTVSIACGSSTTDSKAESKAPIATASKAANEKAGNTSVTAENTLKVKQDKFIEGKHYAKISPEMQTDVGVGEVEVIELMWLGCPHCYHLESTMLKYKKEHPDYVKFTQIPAMLNPSWAADAKTYYLAEFLDPTGEKELITQVFSAMHEQRRRLNSIEAVNRLFVQFGFTEKQIASVRNSMEFQTKLNRAKEIGDSSRVQSVPVLIINGKYRTSPYMAGDNEKLMEILKYLTDKEHKAKN